MTQQKKTVNMQPGILDKMPSNEPNKCGDCKCGTKPEKSCATRKLSDEMPKAKNPRIKRSGDGSGHHESFVGEDE